MKKSFLLLLCIPFIMCTFTCCKNNKGKIKLIHAKSYGAITPIDVYEIIDGNMHTQEILSEQETYHLNKRYNYCTYTYQEKKKDTSSNYYLLSFSEPELKLTFKYDYVSHEIFFYSEFWGEKEPVGFEANLKFKKTYPIKLKEKSDTYKITYYDIEDATGFNDLDSIDEYKKTIEILKTDVKKIEYF